MENASIHVERSDEPIIIDEYWFLYRKSEPKGASCFLGEKTPEPPGTESLDRIDIPFNPFPV